ncbi:MAG TPA: peptidylprolyl isomerase [Bacteroidales bacterium]|jgi:peptidyl-prolyl cis-trans isomerase D|nr:peptidylprolyl isomerase [Bacteroidales bacterium]
MSAIQTLRNKSGLITLIIGIALLSFVITGLDPKLFSSFKTPENVIAKIYGEDYPYEAYYEYYEQAEKQFRNSEFQNAFQADALYNQAWQTFLNSALFDIQFKELGLGVYRDNLQIMGLSDKEFEDITIGENIDSELQRYFQNPKTGMFDKQMLIQTLANLSEYKESNPEFYESWIDYEKALHINNLRNKYNTLVRNALYTTSLEAEMSINDRKTQTDIEYVKIPFESIADETVKVSDSEIAAYYEKVKKSKKYDQEKAVSIDYVTFDITPTPQDIEEIKKAVLSKAEDFKTAKNTSVFLNLNSDSKFDPTYHKKGTLPPAIDSFAFTKAKNDITEMYLEGNVYKIAKISDIRMASDSAKARHILVTGQNAMKEADSLKALLEKGADFGTLAMKHSKDSLSAIKGGLIDWFKEGQMVPSFQDTCFFGEKGKIYLAPSNYGIHIIEILEQGKKSKRVQVQYLSKQITYSQNTRKEVYKKAVEFASENRTKEQFEAYLAKNTTISKKIGEKLGENERSLPGIQDSRAVIRWAHTNKELDKVSDIFTCGDKFVIAVVSKVYEKGKIPLDDIKEQIKAEVIKEKKIAMIKEKLAGINTQTTSLSEIGLKFNIVALTSLNISFAMYSSPEFGMEPKVIATACILEKGKQSQIIEGNTGIFVIKVVDRRTIDTNSDIQVEKTMLTQRASSQLMNATPAILKDKAEVEDLRINFM